MVKLSIGLAILGLALLLFSFVPGQAAVSSAPLAAAPKPLALTAAPVAAAPADVAYGKALFSAKGCVTCHHHAAVPGSGIGSDEFPDLTKYRWDADYLRTWLKDPAAVRPNTYMPDLGLKRDEIEALIAFLSASTR
jgi:cytochrome c2